MPEISFIANRNLYLDINTKKRLTIVDGVEQLQIDFIQRQFDNSTNDAEMQACVECAQMLEFTELAARLSEQLKDEYNMASLIASISDL